MKLIASILIVVTITGCTIKVLNFGNDSSTTDRTESFGYNEENKNVQE